MKANSAKNTFSSTNCPLNLIRHNTEEGKCWGYYTDQFFLIC